MLPGLDGSLYGCCVFLRGLYPAWSSNITNWTITIYFVDFPMNSMVIGPSSWIVNVYQAGYPEIWLVGMLQNSVDSMDAIHIDV